MRPSMIVSLSLLTFVAMLIIACLPVSDKNGEVTGTGLDEKVESLPALPATALNPKIAALVNKGTKTENYAYQFIESIPGQGQQGYSVAVIGKKMKKTYQSPVKLSGDRFYDTVYLDLEKEKATGICAEGGTLCSPHWGKAFSLDFSRENVAFTPVEVLKSIPPSARLAGTEVFDDRNTLLVEYSTSSGTIEKLALDRFYGIPLKREIYEQQDDRLVLQRKYTFTNINVGNLKNDEVALPDTYSLQE